MDDEFGRLFTPPVRQYMKYYQIEPEVAGGWGDNVVADRAVHPPIITHFHYEFDDWLGDDILTSFPCYIVTADLARLIKGENLSGVSFEPVEICMSDHFEQLRPNTKVPPFVRLRPVGVACRDDFGIGTPPHRP